MHIGNIRNACWMVRFYARGGRSEIGSKERDRAIKQLAIALRDALTESDQYETILAALLDGLRPKDEAPF